MAKTNKATIEYIGGPEEETGNVGSVKWGRFEFALNRPVAVDDPHIIRKARSNRFFKVTDDTAGEVAIPGDWKELPAKAKVDLVRKLGNEGVTAGKEAEAVIEAELERRKEAAHGNSKGQAS